MNRLCNVPKIDSPIKIGCTYDEASNSYWIHQVNPDGAKIIGMGFSICGTTKESIAKDIAEALTQMQKIGFEQAQLQIREVLGIYGN